MNAQFDFTGKKVVITGAAGNYASWVAAAFHRANAELWLVDIDGKELENVANTLTGSAKVYTSTMDLTVEENIQQLQREMEAAWQSPDFLINTAALMPGSLMLDLSTEIFDKMFFLNVRTPFWMTKYMSQLMIKYEVKGAIVNFISRSSFVPRIGSVHYATTKAALEIMSRGHSMELAQYGIRVNSINPGFAPFKRYNPPSKEYAQAVIKTIPLGRTSGPDDVPQTVMFLCSDNASYITGTTINVDGGSSAGSFNLPRRD
ncbi:MAG: SDR family oxidoreductase [Clostridia bacterium]|nr:SDR family oxidoreductase [Clostridia bacterium]